MPPYAPPAAKPLSNIIKGGKKSSGTPLGVSLPAGLPYLTVRTLPYHQFIANVNEERATLASVIKLDVACGDPDRTSAASCSLLMPAAVESCWC